MIKIIIDNIVSKFINERTDNEKIAKLRSEANAIIKKHQNSIDSIYNAIKKNKEWEAMFNDVSSVSMDGYKVHFYGDGKGYGGEVKRYYKNRYYIIIYNIELYKHLIDFQDSIVYLKKRDGLDGAYSELKSFDYSRIFSTLVHELVHIKDFEKSDIHYDRGTQILTRMANSGKYNEFELISIHDDLYSNADSEYNAYFLQKLEQFLSGNELKNFDEFKAFMIDIPIYNRMYLKKRKRYLKRVADFFINHKID